jgi:hypothetical protein
MITGKYLFVKSKRRYENVPSHFTLYASEVFHNFVPTLQLNYKWKLTLQRRNTFICRPSPWTDEFKFPTYSAPSAIRGVEL